LEEFLMANRYWVGGSGTWNSTSTTNWSTTSGGASGASAPVAADVALFDANSGTGTVTTDATATAAAITHTAANITVQLGASLSLTGAVTFSSGVIDLVSYTLTASTFVSSYTTARTLAFGAGKIVLVGSGAAVWNAGNHTLFTVTGTPSVELNYSGAVGTRTITNGTTAGTEATAVSFSITAGTDIIAFTNSGRFVDLGFTGFNGTLSNNVANVYGSLTLSSGMTLTAGTNGWTFASTNAATRTVACLGKTLDFPVLFNGVGGSWRFTDAFSLGTTRTLTLTNGTLDGNNQSVTIGNFALGSGTKTLTLGNNTWAVAGTLWNANSNVANLTVSASTGTISMTSASTKTFAGGGKTWPTLNQGGAGALTIQQSNTFTDITDTVQPATITLTSGTTQTVTQFTASGTAGNLITLNASTPGSQATLTDNGGVNSVSYVDIKDIAATGYGEWQAYTSNGNINSGNNVGWVFDAPPAFVASEYPPELRSFTEKRRF
jgi:hypothetical protein